MKGSAIRWAFTRHAVERFGERMAPGLDFQATRDFLIRVFLESSVTEAPDGEHNKHCRTDVSTYRVIFPGPPPLSFRVLGAQDGGKTVVLTILSPLARHLSAKAKRHPRRIVERDHRGRLRAGEED